MINIDPSLLATFVMAILISNVIVAIFNTIFRQFNRGYRVEEISKEEFDNMMNRNNEEDDDE